MFSRVPALCLATVLIFLAVPGFESRAAESTQPPAPAAASESPRALSGVTPAEMAQLMSGAAQELHLKEFVALQAAGPVIVLDLRNKDEFAKRHLAGSINMPLTDVTEKTLPTIAPDKKAAVVLACDYSFAPVRQIAMTIQAYPVLKKAGYTQIYRLNLWSTPGGGRMITEEELDKLVNFEGSTVKAHPVTHVVAAKSAAVATGVAGNQTNAEMGAKLLREAAKFFRDLGAGNAKLKAQMDENAQVYDDMADLLEKDPLGRGGTPPVK
jgi:rhodanese-related sulfurtransferase